MNSSLPVDVSFSFNPDWFENVPENVAASSHFAGSYSDGVECQDQNGYATSDMGTVQPGSAGSSFTGWFIFGDVVTPNQPQGDLQAIGSLLLDPSVDLENTQAGVNWNGKNVVTCQGAGGSAKGIYLGGKRPTSFTIGGCTAGGA